MWRRRSRADCCVLRVVCLLSLCALCTAAADPSGARKSAERLGYYILADSDDDAYARLTESEKAEWEEPVPESASDVRISAEEKVRVHVILVGADDPALESELRACLDRLPQLEAHNISVRQPHGSSSHTLAVARKYFFEVTQASAELGQQLNRALAEAASQHSRTLPVSVVDDLVREDYLRRALPSYAIYILRPQRPRDWYAYSLGQASCDTAAWAGKERYVWLDISAGPLHQFGPLTAGDGVVTQADLPSGRKGPRPEELALQVESFVQRTCRMLISPSVEHAPAVWRRDLEVHLVVLHDHLVGEEERFSFFDFDAVQAELRAFPLFRGQRLRFKRSELSLVDNALCASLYARARKAHTSTVVRGTVRAVVHQYLDSAELHAWLQQHQRQLFELLGEARAPNALPVFLFDVSYADVLLLDRFHQAVAFRDMVIAAQTPVSRVSFDYSCNGKSVVQDPRDATRPVLAALLQALWGISAPYETWEQAHSSARTEYTWAAGNTPFGPFSSAKSASFAQRDAAARHVVLAHWNETLAEVAHLLAALRRYSGASPWAATFPADVKRALAARLNLLQWKTERASVYLSLHDYNASAAFVHASMHDVAAIRKALQQTARSAGGWRCGFNPPSQHQGFDALALLSSLCVLAMLGIIAACRAPKRRSKRVQSS